MTETPDEPRPEEELDSAEQEYDEVYAGDVDPDLDAARELSDEREEDTLTTDDLLAEEEMTEFEAPADPSTPTALGETELDEEVRGTIDDRLAQEEPEDEP